MPGNGRPGDRKRDEPPCEREHLLRLPTELPLSVARRERCVRALNACVGAPSAHPLTDADKGPPGSC